MDVTQVDRPATIPMPTGRVWIILSAISLLGFVVLTVMVEASGGSDHFDLTVSTVAASVRTPVGATAWTVVTWLGSYRCVVAITMGMAVVIAFRTRRLLESLSLCVAVVLSSSVVYLVKIAIGRHRPVSVHSVGQVVSDYSFPSGHTTSGSVLFVLAALLLAGTVRLGWARCVLAVAGLGIAAAIGASRVYLGYHWATDVFAGWLLAAVLVGGAMLPIVVLAASSRGEQDVDTDLVQLRIAEGPGGLSPGRPLQPGAILRLVVGSSANHPSGQ